MTRYNGPMRSPDKTTYYLSPADVARFWTNVDRLGEHWWWVGMYDGRYPKMRLDSGEYAKAGNLALQLSGSPVPAGRRVRYICLQKQCVAPEHLGIYHVKAGPGSYRVGPVTQSDFTANSTDP